MIPLPCPVALLRTWLDLDSRDQQSRLVCGFGIKELESTLRSSYAHSSLFVRSDWTRAKSQMAYRLTLFFRLTMEAMLNESGSCDRSSTLPIAWDDRWCTDTDDNIVRYFSGVFGDAAFAALTLAGTRPSTMTRAPRPKRRGRLPRRRTPSPPLTRITKTEVAKKNRLPVEDWPHEIDEARNRACMTDYLRSTRYEQPLCCAVCARQRPRTDIARHKVCESTPFPPTVSSLLAIDRSSRYYNDPKFLFSLPALDNLMLSSRGVHVDHTTGLATVNICHECEHNLMPARGASHPPRLPGTSLKNHLYIGDLPEDLQDVTWLEEQVCAIHRSTAFVYRLYHSESPLNPFEAKGNSCAFPQDVISTATVLPRTPADINGALSVVFTGPKPVVSAKTLQKVFRIRKAVVLRLLSWLQSNNALYRDVPIDQNHLAMYPEDDALPGLAERVVVNQSDCSEKLFEEETAGFEPHPASTADGGIGYSVSSHEPATNPHDIFIENMGVYDANSVRIPAAQTKAAAIRNMATNKKNARKRATPRNAHVPDLAIPRGAVPLPEYSNPHLFPGMFPTLFPLGTGGFDDATRPVPLGFRTQVEYYMDTADRRFRRHRTFLFVALNVWQRRQAHLFTALTVRRSKFDTIAPKLNATTPEALERVAHHVESGKPLNALNDEDRTVLSLLDEVSSVSSNIPGSAAAKLKMRHEIRGYMNHFGAPHIYLTLNPNTKHSPLFHAMYGDEAVNLAMRFPEMVSSTERAVRVANDPVAGADFFSLSVECFLRDLLGWDSSTATSKDAGGLFGKVRAYYGSAEFTDRGQLHGHFLIWLDGGMNPADIHQKMKANPEWEKRFFRFFESIMKHELPNVADEVDPSFEPRVQRPPDPSHPNFEREFPVDVKSCAEILQRHSTPCKPVCHKYGHTNDCRFGFPHEVFETSSFDEEKNSITLKCRDPTLNWYNPTLLSTTRHNHDIRCILSGKSAKAAMFYISDYITKNDEKMHQVLTMFSRAVAAAPPVGSELDERSRARKIMHKCLASLVREQKIHAQQAVRYLRGNDDSMKSHFTVPMLSRAAVGYVRKIGMAGKVTDPLTSEEHPTPTDGTSEQAAPQGNPFEGDELEDDEIRINGDGDDVSEYLCNQIMDYIYRDAALCDVNFYDFVRCYSKVRANGDEFSGESKARLLRFRLLSPHTQADTHVLVQHYSPEELRPSREKIPRVIGAKIPRACQDEEYYSSFIVAHFVPFSAAKPIDTGGATYKTYLASANLCLRAQAIVKNWGMIHECEDEREAERIRKRQQQTRKRRDVLAELEKQIHPDFYSDPDAYPLPNLDALLDQVDDSTLRTRAVLAQAEWLSRPLDAQLDNHSDSDCTSAIVSPCEPDSELDDPIGHFADGFSTWTAEANRLAREIAARRRAQLDPAKKTPMVIIPKAWVPTASDIVDDAPIAPTQAPRMAADASPSEETAIAAVVAARCLNKEQEIAFRICAYKYFEVLNAESVVPRRKVEPLRMAVDGPGGTGKTYAILSLRMLMASYGQSHRLRTLGPTGAVANMIGGQTVHGGAGIRPSFGTDPGDFIARIRESKKEELTNEWGNTDFLLIDEVSMVGQDLLCQLDAVLRMARDSSEDWFGGLNVVLCGDFYQFEPVGSSSVTRPISANISSSKGTREAMSRLGRMAWKQVTTVVQLHQQMRMAGDPEFGEAVLRLRTKTCVPSDVTLFNSRVVKSDERPNGINLSKDGFESAAAIVVSNLTRSALNSDKVQSRAGGPNQPRLIRCFALHKHNGNEVSSTAHSHLSRVTVTSTMRPAVLELYIGAPVIIRNGNINTELGITTGAQGILRGLQLEMLRSGQLHAPIAIVEFPHNDFQLPGLPKNYYPLKASPSPITGVVRDPVSQQSFTTSASRYQLPFELGFAVTGHSAQGKTLTHVIADLNVGGAAAYVAASRATTRYGLALLHPVTLQSLNVAPPLHIAAECMRLDALAHNTLVRYGYRNAALQAVPDPESERALMTAARITFVVEKTRKRAAGDVDGDAPQRQKRTREGGAAVVGPPAPSKQVRLTWQGMYIWVANVHCRHSYGMGRTLYLLPTQAACVRNSPLKPYPGTDHLRYAHKGLLGVDCL